MPWESEVRALADRGILDIWSSGKTGDCKSLIPSSILGMSSKFYQGEFMSNSNQAGFNSNNSSPGITDYSVIDGEYVITFDDGTTKEAPTSSAVEGADGSVTLTNPDGSTVVLPAHGVVVGDAFGVELFKVVSV